MTTLQQALVRNPSGDEPSVVEMKRRLEEFYSTTTTYDAFNSTPEHSGYYARIVPIIDELSKCRSVVHVLELGSGRSTLADHLGERRAAVHVTAQDITASNELYLRQRCDDVFIGDIEKLVGPYDVVFSLFVLEHVSAPEVWLSHIDRILAPGGYHVVVCPRYDVLGYTCPSLRHLSLTKRWATALQLMSSRLAVLMGGAPTFWVNTDPAVFHTVWYRDADAVHLVSKWDVDRWHSERGYGIRSIRLSNNIFVLRNWVLKNLLTVSSVYRKSGSRLQEG